MRYTIAQFNKDFPTDDACLDVVFENRFGDLKDCPKCGVIGTKFHKVTGRKCYACQWCGYQLHPLSGTIFYKSSTPLKSWFYAMYLFSVSKNGVAAKELERHLGVSYHTAHRIAKQIRKLMAQEKAAMTGIVEVDEAYIGGKRPPKERYQNKVGVVGVVERYGEVRAVAVTKPRMRDTQALLANNVVKELSKVYTDESRLYKRLAELNYTHKVVRHSAHEYVRGGVHTNSVESFWGQLKRSLDGTYHVVSPKYLQTYVDEFVFRYNCRGVAVYPVLLELASKPV